MLKFALMQLRWEYRKDESTAVQRFRWQESGLTHEMAFNAEGAMVLHLIGESGRFEDTRSAALSGYEMRADTPFAMLPAAFQQAEHPTIKEPCHKVPVEGGYVIVFPEGNVIPAALPLFAAGMQTAKAKNHYVLIHLAGKQVTVAAFSEQKPLLLNTFPAGNEAEALYFTVSPFKRAGIAISDVEVEVLTDADRQGPIMQLFGRFLAQVRPCSVSLPYEVGQYPPHADISLLLYTLSQCALPEES